MYEVSRVKAKNNLRQSISKAVEAIGGFDKFVKKGDTVLLKPNFNTADLFPASTDFDFLKAVVGLCYDFGAKLVMLGDSSMFRLNTRKVMEKLHTFDLEKMEQPARVYVFDEKEWIKKEIPGGKYLKSVTVPRILNDADKLILLPCLKTHYLSQFTGALKVSVGFMKPTERIFLHLKNLNEKVAELNKVIHPDLIIMDGRKGFISKGPEKGKVCKPNLILASDDRIAIDVEGIKIIQSYSGNDLEGINPWELTQIKRAVEFGLGAKNEKEYRVTNV